MLLHVGIEGDKVTQEIKRKTTNNSIEWIFFWSIPLYFRIDVDIIRNGIAEIYVRYRWLGPGQIRDIIGKSIEWS